MNLTETNVEIIVNNLTVSYTDDGPVEAPVIIFIHGFPLNKSMWNSQIDALKDECRVIAYDIRGYGDSDAGFEDFSMDLFANDLIAFMDKLEISKAILCGLSMGGYIALNAAVNYPARFEALILCDTQCIADSSKAKKNRLLTIENIKENGLEDFAHVSIKNLFAAGSLQTKDSEIAAVSKMILNTPKEIIYNSLNALANRNETCSKLPEIQIPVLILVGEEDEITPPEMAESMYKKINASQLSLIEHAAHLSNMENPFEFNYQIRKFISSIH